MSERFHIGLNGPAKCTATVKACPFGGESGTENHFESRAEAFSAFHLQNSEKALESLRKKSDKFPVEVTADSPIDLKFSNKEIAKILEDHPTAIVLEPGRYMMIEPGEGTEFMFDDEKHPEYEHLAGKFNEDLNNDDLDDWEAFEQASDDDLRVFAEKRNLEFDQVRFIRDLDRVEGDWSNFNATKGFIKGGYEHGWVTDLAYLDHDKIAKEYPGMFDENGIPKFMQGPTVFELKHKAPVINLLVPNGDEQLWEAADEAETAIWQNGYHAARFTIGDPSRGRGSFLKYKPNE